MTTERDVHDRAVTSARARLARASRAGSSPVDLYHLRSLCSEAVVARSIERHMYRLEPEAKARLIAQLQR